MAKNTKAFTLIELLVVTGIVALLAGVATLAWQRLATSGLDSQAVNTLAKYAAVTRSYALQYRIETILAIEPPASTSSKQRMRLFVHNAPIRGGQWSDRAFNRALNRFENMPGIAGIRVTQNDTLGAEFYYVPALGEAAMLADVAVAPLERDPLGTAPSARWTALCFSRRGKLFARSNVRLVRHDASGSHNDFDGNAYVAAPVALTSRGVKFYKPSALLATLSKNQLSDVTSTEFDAFLATTDPPDLWQAVALNQHSGRLLPME